MLSYSVRVTIVLDHRQTKFMMKFSYNCSLAFIILFLYVRLNLGKQNVGSFEDREEFNITCDPQSQNNCESETLETIAAKVSEQADVRININIPWLQLNSNIDFTNLRSLAIYGIPNLTVISCMTTEADGGSSGIVITDISRALILNNLNLTFCGRNIEIDSYKTYTHRSALTIICCKDVEIDKLVIYRSRGAGMIILEHKGGRFKATSSVFKKNVLPKNSSEDNIFGGGGVYMSLTPYSDGTLLFMSFLFEKCTFQNNIAHNKEYKYVYTDILGELQSEYGRGGGAYIYVNDGLNNINILFVDCKFIRNEAFVGSGLFANIHGRSDLETRNVTIMIKDSFFNRNGCGTVPSDKYSAGFGGGVHLAFSTPNKYGITSSHYIVRNVMFIGNSAELGGGVHYSSYSERQEVINDTNSMLFDNCTFTKNGAHVGSAVAMTPDVFLRSSSGYRVIPTFRDCRFFQNKVFVKKHSKSLGTWQRISGIGTLYSSLCDIKLEGSNTFSSNKGSAIYTVNGIVEMVHSNMSFVNNSGFNGGALGLIGSSRMTVGANNFYQFINNSARYRGGAVYVLLTDSIDFICSRSCFIQYVPDNDTATFHMEWNINFIFTGNKAKTGADGHSIYATSLLPCQVMREGSFNRPEYFFLNASDVFTAQGVIFDNDSALQPQIATDERLISSTKYSPF